MRIFVQSLHQSGITGAEENKVRALAGVLEAHAALIAEGLSCKAGLTDACTSTAKWLRDAGQN